MGLFDFRKHKPADQANEPAGEASPVPSDSQPNDDAAKAPKPSATPESPESEPVESADKAPAQPEFLEATDSFGRRVRVTRDEYRQKVLPDLVKSHSGDPAQLTAVIMQGLQHGFAKEMIGAANRLVVIDKEIERSLSVLSVVQRDAGDLEAAEFSLRELHEKRPDSVAAKVGMAMLAERRGDLQQCETLLWEALQIDPNSADAVHGWLQVRLKDVGDEGHGAELDKLIALPNSWRPQLWRARFDIQQGRIAAAETAYREQLARPQVESDALLMAATDLMQADQNDLVAELIVPLFKPGRDHPHVGLALLQHFVATKKEVAGADLLHQMHLHYGHMVAEHLNPYTAEFDRMRLEKLAPLEIPKEPRIGLFRLEWPSFCAALHDPQWLLPQKADGHKQILFVALSIEGQPSTDGQPGGTEDYGRLTRAVPMFLAEHVWLSTPHRGTVALPMAHPGGWALMGRPLPEEEITAQLGDNERKHTILVTGVLRFDGDTRRIDLWAYDVATRQRIGHAASEGSQQDLGRMLLQLMGELWPLIGGPKEHKPPVGDDAFWQRYAEALGQHASLAVTRAGAMPRDRLYGERYIVQWLQASALQEPRWQPGFWLYASALCLLDQLGSPIAKEHARTIAELFRQSPPQSPFARLAIAPLRAVGQEALWRARRDEIVAAAGGDLAYGQWLGRAEAAK